MITDAQVMAFKDTYNLLAGHCDFESARSALEACAVALYEAPQTREPLSEEELFRLFKPIDNKDNYIAFARAIEQAHGIGVDNETPT